MQVISVDVFFNKNLNEIHQVKFNEHHAHAMQFEDVYHLLFLYFSVCPSLYDRYDVFSMFLEKLFPQQI